MTIIVNSDYVAECENGFIVMVNNHNLHCETVGQYIWYEITDKETGKLVDFVRRGQTVNRVRKQLCDEIGSAEFIRLVRQLCLDDLGI